MFVESMFVLDKMTTCGDRISIKYVRFFTFEAQIKWWFWFSNILQLQKTHFIRQIKNLFDVSKIMKAFNSLFISVACERCSALELSATYLVFPAVQWATFSVNIFFFCSPNVVVYDSVSATNYFSQISYSFERNYWVTLKYIS